MNIEQTTKHCIKIHLILAIVQASMQANTDIIHLKKSEIDIGQLNFPHSDNQTANELLGDTVSFDWISVCRG